MVSVEEAKQALTSHSQYIKSIEAEGNTIVVRPVGYIKDKGIWASITNIVASLGGKYIPERNNNTWQLPLTVQNEPGKFTPSDQEAVLHHIDEIAARFNADMSALRKEVDEMLKR